MWHWCRGHLDSLTESHLLFTVITEICWTPEFAQAHKQPIYTSVNDKYISLFNVWSIFYLCLILITVNVFVVL